eukprot:SAG31_NODE_34257_length_335_cov_0.648305_1_plen_21_part_10
MLLSALSPRVALELLLSRAAC